MRSHGCGRFFFGRAALAVQLLSLGVASAATVPSGFVDSPYVQLPSNATAMEFAPDGRLFICAQNGNLLVVKNGVLLTKPFITLPVDTAGERGLLGVAFDPYFATNKFVYVFYTAKTPTIHNRVSRLTADGDVAVAGSEVVLIDLTTLGTSLSHNGGAIHFGNDGKLYIAVGDNRIPDNAQSLGSVFGKVLRINRNGSVPADNPFVDRTSGVNRAIWALGLRNPFTTAFQRSTGRLYINDVGEEAFEEINQGIAGANYGWPAAEGAASDPAFTNPVHLYGHVGEACAITGGAFYEPAVLKFPSWYHRKYFFADYCAGWIKRFNPGTGTVNNFASGIIGPVDLKVGPDGALYYLARNAAQVGRISYAVSEPPVVTRDPESQTIGVGQSVTFDVGVTGSTPLTFQWRRNRTPISGATGSSYRRTNVQLADNGAYFDVTVSNDFGTASSEPAQLTVLQNKVPTASITKPVIGTTYAGGTVINYAGTANDAEDGSLPASGFTWWVDFHHENHIHPFILPIAGSKSGSFTIPKTGEKSAEVFYRIKLKVQDSAGLTRTVGRDILPRKSTITLATDPSGLQLKLDWKLVTAPYSFVGVVGINRRIEAVSPQTAFGAQWDFSTWSDGDQKAHVFSTPSTNRTYTATFTAQ